MKLYKKQRNYVVNLPEKLRNTIFRKYHMAHFLKTFGNFANLIKNFDDKIILVENEKVVSKNEEIAYLFNTYFNDITKGLNIKR